MPPWRPGRASAPERPARRGLGVGGGAAGWCLSGPRAAGGAWCPEPRRERGRRRARGPGPCPSSRRGQAAPRPCLTLLWAARPSQPSRGPGEVGSGREAGPQAGIGAPAAAAAACSLSRTPRPWVTPRSLPELVRPASQALGVSGAQASQGQPSPRGGLLVGGPRAARARALGQCLRRRGSGRRARRFGDPPWSHGPGGREPEAERRASRRKGKGTSPWEMTKVPPGTGAPRSRTESWGRLGCEHTRHTF